MEIGNLTKNEMYLNLLLCMDEIYTFIMKLEFVSDYAIDISEIKKSDLLQRITRVAMKKSIHQSMKKEILEDLCIKAIELKDRLNKMYTHDTNISEAEGIRFIEYDESLGIVDMKDDKIVEFIQRVYYVFKKDITILIRKHNNRERNIIEKYVSEYEDISGDYNKYRLTVNKQVRIIGENLLKQLEG